jgi:hypothetical protein
LEDSGVTQAAEDLADEVFAEAQILLVTECPDADIASVPGAGDAYDAGVWFGIAACICVFTRHGLLSPKDGGSDA